MGLGSCLSVYIGSAYGEAYLPSGSNPSKLRLGEYIVSDLWVERHILLIYPSCPHHKGLCGVCKSQR